MASSQLSPEFRRRIEALTTDGRSWLDCLPRTLEACAKRWGLSIESPVADLSYNYVAPAVLKDGRQAVLKLGPLSHELACEITALQVYDGRGCVRLIDSDPGAGVLLLERLNPGRMLAALCPEDDEEATRIAARVMKRLWRPVGSQHPFPTVARWAKGFERLRSCFQGGTGPFPNSLVEEAEAIFERLLATTETVVLLHGDLHHYNILSAEREPWLAIDPKGLVGDPAYEAGALLRNPVAGVYTWPDLAGIQSRRLTILAGELQIPRRRIQEWAFAQVVLSAWWSYEDEGQIGKDWIPFAEQLRDA